MLIDCACVYSYCNKSQNGFHYRFLTTSTVLVSLDNTLTHVLSVNEREQQQGKKYRDGQCPLDSDRIVAIDNGKEWGRERDRTKERETYKEG